MMIAVDFRILTPHRALLAALPRCLALDLALLVVVAEPALPALMEAMVSLCMALVAQVRPLLIILQANTGLPSAEATAL